MWEDGGHEQIKLGLGMEGAGARADGSRRAGGGVAKAIFGRWGSNAQPERRDHDDWERSS